MECKWDDVQRVSLYRLSIYQTYDMHASSKLFVIYVKYATLKKKKESCLILEIRQYSRRTI